MAGAPITAATYPLTITAHNTSGPDATQTFTLNVTGGSLSITVPPTANLGSGTVSSVISATLGTVQVTDTRNAPSWTTTVTATNFTTGAGTTAETIPKSAASYWSGPTTATSGTGTFTPGQATAGAAQTLSTPRTALTFTDGTGNNTASWSPTLVITIPATAVAGTYTATITHSVA